MSDTRRLTFRRRPIPGFYDNSGRFWGRSLVEARTRMEAKPLTEAERARIMGRPGGHGDRLD